MTENVIGLFKHFNRAKIMMNINEINKEIDSLYQSGKIDEAETYMKDQLTKAKEDGIWKSRWS